MTSLADKAYAILLQRFIIGHYMPGDKLSENQLSQELNMSRTPIRTALIRLIRKNYIQSVDKKGIIVNGFSDKDFLDTCFFLADLQKIALNELVQRSNLTLIQELDEIIAAQIDARDCDDYYRYLTSTYDYMERIFIAYNNQALLQAFHQLRQNTVRMSMIIYNLTKHEPHYSTIDMFTLLNEALLAQDQCAISKYIDSNRKRILAFEHLFTE